jgi:hypothetical protein
VTGKALDLTTEELNNYANTAPKYRPLSTQADKETRELVAEIRKQNGVPIPEQAKTAHWPKQVGELENGLKFNKKLSPEELVRLSEFYQAEFEMVVYRDGSVLIRKGPSVGSHLPNDPVRGNPAGRTVGGDFPDPDNVVALYHTHPSGAPNRNFPSVEDMIRGTKLKNLRRDQKFIVTRNMKGEARVIPVHDLP